MAASAPDASPQSASMRAARSLQSLDGRQDAASDDGGDSIRVYVRVRPPLEREQPPQQPQQQPQAVGLCPGQPVVSVESATSSVLLRGEPPRSFTFDGVLDDRASQESTFDLVGRTAGASCLSGYNASIYVYGQTGTGKTYTMFGPVASAQQVQFDERRGLSSRLLDHVFGEINRRRSKEADGCSYVCRCSFLEIYKEQIMDLLEPGSSGLQIREDINRGVYVERLSEPTVSSQTEAFQVLWKGFQNRHIGATQMNERSSRSHAVFTLSVERAQTTAGVTSTRVAHVHLVDLAGSERQLSASAAGPDFAGAVPGGQQTLRVKEAGAINKSLSALTNVIMSLSREERTRRRSQDASPARRGFVHYRDSKLTFLLRDSLGGNSKTVIVANISPSAMCYAETLSTLKFAARAKHIRCAAVRNEEFSGTLESLMQEVKTLRQRLADLKRPGVPPAAPAAASAADEEAAGGALPAEDAEMFSRTRVRRLEVLLLAALERERHAEQRRHQLTRLAGFLEDLDFRKSQHVRQLHADYLAHVAHIESAAISNEPDTQELTAKLQGFGHLLGNLLADAGPLYVPAAAVGSGAVGVENGVESSNGGLLDAESRDEKALLREENRRLRAQLERHPEAKRLAAENAALRARLGALDPAAGAAAGVGAPNGTSSASAALLTTPERPKAGGHGLDGSSSEDDDDGGRGAPGGRRPFESPSASDGGLGGLGGVPPPPPPRLSAEVLLRSVDAGEDGRLRTWMYFQKMAKEVEDLIRAKESLESVVSEVQQDDSGACFERFGLVAPGAPGDPGAPGAPGRGAAGGGAGGGGGGGLARGAAGRGGVVSRRVVEELAQVTDEALRKARAVLDGAHGGASSSSSSAAAPPPGALAGGAGAGAEAEAANLRQALQRVRHLHGTLDAVSGAYTDASEEFQRLREDYESRLEECEFYELQCSRLDMHCHELIACMAGADGSGDSSGSAGGAGGVGGGARSLSATGLHEDPLQNQKRSFSLSNLRDAHFWENRFEQLSQLTGIAEADLPAAGAPALAKAPPALALPPRPQVWRAGGFPAGAPGGFGPGGGSSSSSCAAPAAALATAAPQRLFVKTSSAPLLPSFAELQPALHLQPPAFRQPPPQFQLQQQFQPVPHPQPPPCGVRLDLHSAATAAAPYLAATAPALQPSAAAARAQLPGEELGAVAAPAVSLGVIDLSDCARYVPSAAAASLTPVGASSVSLFARTAAPGKSGSAPGASRCDAGRPSSASGTRAGVQRASSRGLQQQRPPRFVAAAALPGQGSGRP